MKKFIFATLVIIPAILSAFDFSISCPHATEVATDLKVINVFDLNEKNFVEVLQGNYPDVAIEFSANSVLPIRFFLKGDLISLAENEEHLPVHLEVRKTFYVRCMQDDLFFSSNLSDWKPFVDFATGSLSFAFCFQKEQTSILMGAETNLRS